jgi:hypothetical protein
MRSASLTSGSIPDRLNAAVIQVKGLRDAAEAVYRFPQLFRSLESVADRVASVRRRGGVVQGLAPAVAWLRQAIEESPALSEPTAAGLRAELLAMLDRVHRGG